MLGPPALSGSLSKEWAKDSRAHGGLGASNGSSPAPVSLRDQAASPTVNEILQVVSDRGWALNCVRASLSLSISPRLTSVYGKGLAYAAARDVRVERSRLALAVETDTTRYFAG